MSVTYGEDIVTSFCEDYDVDLICRAHQVCFAPASSFIVSSSLFRVFLHPSAYASVFSCLVFHAFFILWREMFPPCLDCILLLCLRFCEYGVYRSVMSRHTRDHHVGLSDCMHAGVSLWCCLMLWWRGLQVFENGYEFFADKQLVTVFSAPDYAGEYDNSGAMMSVNEDLLCSFQVCTLFLFFCCVQLFSLQG